MKLALMRDPDFDISSAFRQFTQSSEISREDMLAELQEHLDVPHIDILFAKLSANSTSKQITYAQFIESITPRNN